jgi:beta-1,4-mannosyl-glycoprotein beta-1,4-N-acetylglucosaminyltransferase
MKIIDTTTYFEEKLMMSLRFNILNLYVDNFIVCEARFTHSGKKKDISFKKTDFQVKKCINICKQTKICYLTS